MSQDAVSISVQALRKVFGANPALDGVTLEFLRASCTA
jgi:ABC-type sugar transport system ATPase subunit